MFWMMSVLIIVAYGMALLISYSIRSNLPLESEKPVIAKGWTRSSWPFLKDQFPAGLTFDCTGEWCGGRILVTVRTKIGFCNCITGVSDDEELERVSDRELVSGESRPIGDGNAVAFGGLEGRMRAYVIEHSENGLLSIAYNNKCDVVVATAFGSSSLIKENATELLNSAPVREWIAHTLNL